MKAAYLTEWKKLGVADLPVPQIVDGQSLIRVSYAGICGSDVHIFEGNHPTARAPMIMGHEFVGIVEKISGDTKNGIKIGDRVTAYPLISCGQCAACIEGNPHVCRTLKLLGIHTNGGFAEYVAAGTETLVKVNEQLSDQVAALSEPFAVGVHVNERAGTRKGSTVLIIGGGPIGLICGMVARYYGASQIVYSEINLERIAQIKAFGFPDVIDPKNEDANVRANALTGDRGFDVVLEVSGSQPGLIFSTQACAIRGTIVPVGFPGKRPEFDVLQCIFKELTLIGSRVYSFDHFAKAVLMLEDMVMSGEADPSRLISDVYPVAESQRALQKMVDGQNLGKILIRM
jgi:2-desacetyl-2-hydroxyethyl bacteriochlorophyllide A dehydrogenase